MWHSPELLCAEDVSTLVDDEPNAIQWTVPPFSGRLLPDLLAAEADHLPLPDYLPRLLARSVDPTARRDAVEWILKVVEFHRFSPVTACLAVGYLDRFLSMKSLEFEWAMQLVGVACVAVAAKMEETQVPMLLNLQILEPRYVFEHKTVVRMELLLLSSLQWRMRLVTPFDFLEPFLSDGGGARPAVVSRAAYLIISTHCVVEFLAYRPSVIAAAAVLCAAEEIGDLSVSGDAGSMGCSDEFMSKEMVKACCQLMKEHLIDACPSAAVPPSPVGVLDAAACGSCEFAAFLEEKAEPPCKRLRRSD